MATKERTRLAQRVVRARDKQHKSWATIADDYDLSAGTARRLYDEVKGAGAHVGLLPGKGGRLPVQQKKGRTTKRAA